MSKKNKLSIYLIKEKFSESEQLILKKDAVLLSDLGELGKVFYRPSQISEPPWLSTFFRGSLQEAQIYSANACVTLIVRVPVSDSKLRTFAVTMGYGKNILANDVVEEDFGLKVVLNTISPSSLRRINKINVGGNQKTSNEQLPLESDIDDFGFDIDRDLVSTITGQSDDDDFVSGIMTGSDQLSLTAAVDVTSLSNFRKIAYARYTASNYKDSFGWIDHIRRVKSKTTINELDSKVINLINEGSPKVWMAVPEVLEWENIIGFKYAGYEIHDDIDLATVCANLREPLSRIDQLKNKHISAVRADNGERYASWQAYKCLYAEVDHNGVSYCINNGRWFSVDQNFVRMVNEEYERIPVSEMAFMPHSAEHTKENQYTQAFVNSDPEHLLCMDAKVVSHGGGRSKIELCDVLTENKTFIHIKPYSGSATLSHLFNQAVVSAELVMSDPEFRTKANKKIKAEGASEEFLIPADCHPNVILAIISEHSDSRPPIPFFSKIALRYAVRRLRTFGCKVYIKNIQKAA